jgi:uncharacterized membrane protein
LEPESPDPLPPPPSQGEILMPEGAESSPRVTRHTRVSIGPLPDPETLQRYEEILPGAAERIFKSFELESQHRRELDKGLLGLQKQEQGDLSRSDWVGQGSAFFVMMTGFGLAYHLSNVGLEQFIPHAIGYPITAVVIAFITGKVSNVFSNRKKGEDEVEEIEGN